MANLPVVPMERDYVYYRFYQPNVPMERKKCVPLGTLRW